MLAIAFKRPPYFPPGTAFHYSNTNYALLDPIAEEREHGKPLAKVLQDRLFGPPGMNDTALPASTSNTVPDPYSHGYMYGSSSFALVDQDYPPDIQAAAGAGTLKPNDYTSQNPSYASAAGGVISTANDLVTWIQTLVGGRVFSADYQRRWLDSLQPEDPSKPRGQQYGYGIAQLRFGPNVLYFHGGEMPGYNSFMGYDPTNRVTLVVWTNLTVSPDGKPTANNIMLKVRLREELRTRHYVPIMFGFEKPKSRDTIETIRTLAWMSKFIIADLTDAKAVVQELQAIVPNLPSVAVRFIIKKPSESPECSTI